MTYRFFDMLRVATRDSILEGANQAGEILLQGTEAATERTESVAKMEWAIHAVVGGETPAPPPGRSVPNSNPEPHPALDAKDEDPKAQATESPAPQSKPKAASQPAPRKAKPVNPADKRTPKSSVKSESIFDAGPSQSAP